MLNFKNIALRRGVRVLFANSSFTIHKGQKVGFTGANGAGKSSLFALVKNELHLDEGDFSMPPNLEIAHVAQETPAVTSSAIDYVIDGDQQLRRLQKQLALAARGSASSTTHPPRATGGDIWHRRLCVCAVVCGGVVDAGAQCHLFTRRGTWVGGTFVVTVGYSNAGQYS